MFNHIDSVDGHGKRNGRIWYVCACGELA